MNELPTPEALVSLINELASRYVGKPEQLQARVQESTDGAAYFMMRGEPEDDSRLVGNEGCHVNALAFLVEQFGKANHRAYTFRLLTTPDSGAPHRPPLDALDYDPRPARDLLCRILAALGVEGFAVEVTPGAGPRRSLFFAFDIKIADARKAEDLTIEKPFVVKKGKNGEPDRVIWLTIVGALGTLFRAIAKQNGIRFQLRLAERVSLAKG